MCRLFLLIALLVFGQSIVANANSLGQHFHSDNYSPGDTNCYAAQFRHPGCEQFYYHNDDNEYGKDPLPHDYSNGSRR
jgi:hypothetical protein